MLLESGGIDMEINEELIDLYLKKKKEVDILSDEDIFKIIYNGRTSAYNLSEFERFKYAYALLKKDFIDEAYSYINDYFLKLAETANKKGENIFYSELDDFISGMLCCACCTDCEDDCNCGSCCGLFIMLAICSAAFNCDSGKNCVNWIWNDLFIEGFCETVDSCCCEKIWC